MNVGIQNSNTNMIKKEIGLGNIRLTKKAKYPQPQSGNSAITQTKSTLFY